VKLKIETGMVQLQVKYVTDSREIPEIGREKDGFFPKTSEGMWY
jgi:hypothetical protein